MSRQKYSRGVNRSVNVDTGNENSARQGKPSAEEVRAMLWLLCSAVE